MAGLYITIWVLYRFLQTDTRACQFGAPDAALVFGSDNIRPLSSLGRRCPISCCCALVRFREGIRIFWPFVAVSGANLCTTTALKNSKWLVNEHRQTTVFCKASHLWSPLFEAPPRPKLIFFFKYQPRWLAWKSFVFSPHLETSRNCIGAFAISVICFQP